jgi:2-hydroxy-3-oxopropionate reductase
MARLLLDKGFDVVVNDCDCSAAGELVEAGARAAADPASLAADVPVLLTSLPGVDEVREVLLGSRGVATNAAPGGIVVDTSTITPRAARVFANDLQKRGLVYLDAPVSGGPTAARQGTLSVMVGGEARDIARAEDVLHAIGKSVLHCGPSGAGQICKACNQLVVIGTLEVVAEALVLARVSGLDPYRVREALLGGYAASRVLELHGLHMLDRDFSPGGRTRFNSKDIATIEELSAETGLKLPAFSAAAEMMRRLIDGGGGDLDNAAIVTVLEDSLVSEKEA